MSKKHDYPAIKCSFLEHKAESTESLEKHKKYTKIFYIINKSTLK